MAGDQILIEAASDCGERCAGSDTVARVGGDEFVVVMPDITPIAEVEQCAVNLVTKLSPEISIDEQLVHVTASVGVCVYPDFASDARHLLKRADAAMYAAKENGRNQHQIFSEDMLKETTDRLTMEHALRHALANEELSPALSAADLADHRRGDGHGGAAALEASEAGRVSRRRSSFRWPRRPG